MAIHAQCADVILMEPSGFFSPALKMRGLQSVDSQFPGATFKTSLAMTITETDILGKQNVSRV